MEMGNERDRPGVIAPPPLIFGAAILLGLVIHMAAPVAWLPGGFSFRVILGAPLVAASFLLGLWGAWTMRRAGTNIDPHKPATALVVTGPFRFTRNPLYLSLTLLYMGVTALANALWPLVFLPVVLVVVRRGVIDREERYLEGKFGEAYREYKAAVRRWL